MIFSFAITKNRELYALRVIFITGNMSAKFHNKIIKSTEKTRLRVWTRPKNLKIRLKVGHFKQNLQGHGSSKKISKTLPNHNFYLKN